MYAIIAIFAVCGNADQISIDDSAVLFKKRHRFTA